MNKNDVTVNYAFQEYISEKELNEREIKEVSKILTYEEPRWTLKDTASALKIIKEADSSLYETIQSYIKEQHLPSENVLYLDFGKSLRYDHEYMGDFSKETLADKLDNRFIVRYSHDNDEGNLIDGGDEIIINDKELVSLFNGMIEEHVKENIQKYDDYKIQREASKKDKLWTWKDYDDLSGHLESPDGKSYFEYDWTTKEYKITSDSGWDSFIDADPTRDTSLSAFKEYAQDYIKNNIAKNKDIVFEREYIDIEKWLEEEEKRMAKSETLADKYNRMEKLFEDKLSHLGSGNGETFKELCKWVEEEFPEKDSEGVLLEATSRMIEENLDFAEFDYQNYDDVYGFGDGADWRFDLSDSAAKMLVSDEIITLSDAQSLIWEKAEKVFAELKNNPQYKDEIEITDRINSAFRIADYLYPEFTKEIDKEKNLLPDEWPQYSREEKKNVINNAFEHLYAAFKENRVVLNVYDEDRLIIVDKSIPLKDFETLIKGRDAVNFGKESLTFTRPNAEQLQTGIENGWELKEILTGYDVFQELDRFNETGQMLAELEAEKEFVPSEYVLSKLKEKGIEVVTDKEEFDRILESQNILQKLEPHSTEEKNPLFLANKNELKAFAQKIDDWKAGNLKPTEVISEFSTSIVLQSINIPANKVAIDQLVLKKINALETEKVGNSYGHDIDIETIKKIPQYLSDPIMVYNSASRKDSYTVLTEAVDKNNESILIALQINKFEDGIYVNNITSAYGKDENEWFIEQIKLGNLVYQDKKRSLEWTNPRRLSLPNQMTTQGSLNVIQKEDIVKQKTPNFSFSERHFAFTENQQEFLRELGFTNSVDGDNSVLDWKMSKTIPETNKIIYFETGVDKGRVNCFACYEIDESKDNVVRTDLLRRYAEEKNAFEGFLTSISFNDRQNNFIVPYEKLGKVLSDEILEKLTDYIDDKAPKISRENFSNDIIDVAFKNKVRNLPARFISEDIYSSGINPIGKELTFKVYKEVLKIAGVPVDDKKHYLLKIQTDNNYEYVHNKDYPRLYEAKWNRIKQAYTDEVELNLNSFNSKTIGNIQYIAANNYNYPNPPAQTMTFSDGTTYGFAHNGKIYLNPDVLSSEVAMHEYTHLWDNLTRKDNPELWNKGLQIFKDTSLWNEVVNDENYADIKDDENLVLSECHARITGKVAEAVLNRIAEQDGTEKQAEMVDWDKETINFIFENYRDVFAKNGFETVAEFTSATMKDLFIPVEQQKRDISNSSAYERMKKLFEGKNADYFGNSSSNDFKEIYHFLKNEFPLKDALHETVSCMIYSNINFGALEPANYDVVYDKEGVDERYNITGEIAKMLINNEIPSDWMAIQNEVNDFASRRLMDLKENNPDMLVTDSINEAFEISKKYNPLEEKILTVYTKSEKTQNIQKALENIEKTYTEDSHDIRIDYGTGIFGADLEALIKGNDAAIYGEKFLDFVRPDRVSLELGIEDNIPFKDLIRGYGDNFFSESEGVKVPVHIERWEYMEVFDSDYDAAQQWCRETGGKLLENGKDIWISDEKLEHYCYPDTPENREILKEYLLPQPLEFNWDNFTEEQFNAVKEEITSGKIKEDYKGQVYVGSVCAEFTITDKESNWVDYNNYILGEKGEGEISGIPYSYKFGKQVGMDTFIENTYEDFKTVIKNVLMQDFGKDSHLKQEAMRQTINWATINENNKDAAIALWNEKMGLTITHSITFPCGFTFPKEVYENDLGENKREEYRWKIYEKIKDKYSFNDNDAETEYFPGTTPSESSFNISFSVSVPEEIKINLEKVNKWIESVENFVKEECGCTFINWQGGERNEQTFVNEKQLKMQQERNSDFAHPNAEDLEFASSRDIKDYCKLNSEIELTDEQVREINNFYDNNDQFALYVSPAGNLYERDEYKEELISADSELLKAGNHLRTLEGKERLDYLLKNTSVDEPEWSTGLLNQLSNTSDERFRIVSDVLSDSFATLDRHDNFCKVLLEYGADPTKAIRIAAEDANLGDNLNWLLDNVPESQLNQIFSDNGYADAVFDIAQKSVEHDMNSWHGGQDIGFEGFKRIARLCEREADADHYYGKLLEKAFKKPVEPKIMQLLDTPELLAEKMNAQHIHQNEPEITKEQASAILDYCNYENIKFYCDKNGDIFSLDVSENYNGEGLKEDNFGIAANGIEYARKAKELNYSCYSTATFNMVSELWQKERQFVNPSVENISNAKEKVLNKPTLSFIDDEEKMRDFATISKEEFLSSYSYLSEKEYEATEKEYNELNQSAVQSNVSNTVKTVEDVNKVYDRNLDFIEQNISFKESNPEYNEIDEIQKWKNGELFIPVADGNGNFTNDMEANTLDDYNIYSGKNFGSYSEIIKYQADLKAELLDTAIENNIKEYLRREYAEPYPYSGKFEVTVENQSYPIDKDGLDYIANSDEWSSVEDRLNDVIDRRFEEEIEQKENDILSDVKEYIAQETNGNLILKDSELREVLFSEELVQIYAPKEDFLANQPEEVKAALVEAGIARSELYNNVESIPVSEEARNAMLSASYVGQGGITQKAFADNGIEIDLATANALENCFLQIEAMTKYTADGHDLFHSGNGVDTISEHTIEYSEANKAWFVHEKNWLALSAIKGNEAEPDDYMEKAGRVGDRNWALSCKELVKYVYQEIKVDGEMEKEFPDTFKKLEKLNAYLEAPERIKENGFQRRKEDYFANIKVSTENFRDVFNEIIKLPKFKDKPLEAASWCFSKVPKENKAEVAQWFSNLGCKTKKDTNKLFNKWNRENNPKLNVNKSKNNDKDDWSISD